MDMKDFIDFSTNLNPLGPPSLLEKLILEAVKLKTYVSYPDYEYCELKEAISSFHGISKNLVSVTNGSAEALNLAIFALSKNIVAVVTLSPTYGEQDLNMLLRVLGKRFCPIKAYRVVGNRWIFNIDFVLEKIQCFRDALVILSNPNNPTGSLLELRLLEELAQELSRFNCILMVDEVYIDFIGDEFSGFNLNMDNLIITRSYTKIFSIPGLRIGIIYSPNRNFVKRIEHIRSPWNVNIIASYAITKFLEFREELNKYLEVTRGTVKTLRKELVKELNKVGFRAFDSCSNYILSHFYGLDCIKLRDFLVRKYSILIRPCHNFIGLSREYFRVSVRPKEEIVQLVRALKDFRRINEDRG